MPCCCAYQCKSRTEKKDGKTFHRFPFRNRELVKRWTINIRRKNWKPTRSTLICSDHFTEDCFDRTGSTTRLREAAVPTLFKFPPHLQKKVSRPRTTKNSSNTKLVPIKEQLCQRRTSNTSFENPQLRIQQKTVPDSGKSSDILYTICTKPSSTATVTKGEDHAGRPEAKTITMDHTYAILQSPRKLKELLNASWEREAILREKLKISRQHERRSKVKIQTLRNIINSLQAQKRSSKNAASQCQNFWGFHDTEEENDLEQFVPILE